MNWLHELIALIARKPIVIFRFNEYEWEQIRDSRRGISEFTFSRLHETVRDVKAGSLCLIHGNGNDTGSYFIGIVNSKSAVTTIDSRIKIKRCILLDFITTQSLLTSASDDRQLSALNDRLESYSSVTKLSEKMSLVIIESLSKSHASNLLRLVSEKLIEQKKFTGPLSQEIDAISVALKSFGLEPDAQASYLSVPNQGETALRTVNLLEDAVIENDARHIPGYVISKSDMTGRAIFSGSNGTLEVITANKRPLEEVFGVDLIYFNRTMGNLVMLQYKMLERIGKSEEDTDWICRVDDQLEDEVERMLKFNKMPVIPPSEYRLNASAFFFKFVRRNGEIGRSGIITPLDHFLMIINSPKCIGPRGGIRVSFNSLQGSYLRDGVFVDLVRAGYVGTHQTTTEQFQVLIDSALNNDHAIVLAIQKAKPIENYLDPQAEDGKFNIEWPS